MAVAQPVSPGRNWPTESVIARVRLPGARHFHIFLIFRTAQALYAAWVPKAVGSIFDLAGDPWKSVSIRMPEQLWELITDEAARGGMSASEFTRLAALAAVWYRRGERGHPYGDLLQRLGLLDEQREGS